jgi:hypothetical protein
VRSLAWLLLGGLAVLAALTFLNVVRLEVNATLPPVSKNLNLSVYPLASARWAASDIYNVTYYGVKFVPRWPELYAVGYFVPRHPGWSARLEAVARSGAGQYAIAPGRQVQITESQNAGLPCPSPEPRRRTGEYSPPNASSFSPEPGSAKAEPRRYSW